MLLWEQLQQRRKNKKDAAAAGPEAVPVVAPSPRRSKFDNRCAAMTKYGRRCRGKVSEGSEYCSFHDPAMTSDKRKRNAAKGGKSNRNLSHLLDGYLRPLTDESAVGNALDRLYREVRLGKVTPEMGRVLLDILVRIHKAGFAPPVNQDRDPKRTKVYKLARKMDELLTRAEKIAWRKAVANAPKTFVHDTEQQAQEPQPTKRKPQQAHSPAEQQPAEQQTRTA